MTSESTIGNRVGGCLLAMALLLSGCGGAPPAKQYELSGQILAVHSDRQELAIKHDDIVGYMPGMTMSFPVATKSLMVGRTPGAGHGHARSQRAGRQARGDHACRHGAVARQQQRRDD
jgi:Cu/Ag efflux protein CusF